MLSKWLLIIISRDKLKCGDIQPVETWQKCFKMPRAKIWQPEKLYQSLFVDSLFLFTCWQEREEKTGVPPSSTSWMGDRSPTIINQLNKKTGGSPSSTNWMRRQEYHHHQPTEESAVSTYGLGEASGYFISSSLSVCAFSLWLSHKITFLNLNTWKNTSAFY